MGCGGARVISMEVLVVREWAASSRTNKAAARRWAKRRKIGSSLFL